MLLQSQRCLNRSHHADGGYGPLLSEINSLIFFEGTVTITLALFSHASEATVTLALTVQEMSNGIC